MAIRVFSHYLQLPQVLLAAAEMSALAAAPYIGALIRFRGSISAVEHTGSTLSLRALVFALLGGVCLIAMGLYSARQRAKMAGLLVRIAASIAGATMLMALVSYAVPSLAVGRGWLGLTAAIALILVITVRTILNRFIDEEVFKRRVLVYGAGKQALSLSRLRRRSDQRGFKIVAYIGSGDQEPSVALERIVQPDGALLDYVREQQIDEVVIAMDDRRRAFPVHELLECRLGGIDVIDIVSFLERETGKVRLDVLNPSWLIFSDGFRRDLLRQVSERVFDIITAASLLSLTWPVMLLTALAILAEDGLRSPVFYRQRRVGLEGREFSVLKFRSMRPDAERDGQPRWADAADARVTRVGSFMRKVRIDELPQLINVLKGEMGFVGPRPERPEFVAELSEQIPYYRERHCVKPGITGWAQLCYPYGSSAHDATEKLQYDLYYVKNHSLLFDLAILLQTVEVVLLGKGGR
jgi:sugar transferase (PEP-CTERM system associated)